MMIIRIDNFMSCVPYNCVQCKYDLNLSSILVNNINQTNLIHSQIDYTCTNMHFKSNL